MVLDSDSQPEQSSSQTEQHQQPSNQELLAQIAQLYRKANILQKQMNPSTGGAGSSGPATSSPSATNEAEQQLLQNDGPTFPSFIIEEPSRLTKQQRDRQELFQYLQGRDAPNDAVREVLTSDIVSNVAADTVVGQRQEPLPLPGRTQMQMREGRRSWHRPSLQEPAVRLVRQYKGDTDDALSRKEDAFEIDDDDSGMAMTQDMQRRLEEEGDLSSKQRMKKATDDTFSVVVRTENEESKTTRSKRARDARATIGRLDAYDYKRDFGIRI